MRSPDLQLNASGPHREGASSISRGGALAQCRGFGTCGWKGVGTPENRPNSARGILRRNGTGHPEWVRCHGPRAGRRFPPRLRKGGAASVLGRLGNPSSRSWRLCIPSLLKTERRGRGLDSVARDNLADSLMAQGQRCLPYPNPTWQIQSATGGRPLRGAGRQPVIAESTPSPGGMLNHPRDTALERLSVWIRNTGGSPECRGPRQPLLLLRAGREATRMGATRTRTSWHGHPHGPTSGSSGPPGGQASGNPGHGWAPSSSGRPTIPRYPGITHAGPGMASSSSLPTGNYPRY